MKRLFVTTVLLVLCIITVLGCAPAAKQTPPASQPPTTATTAKPVTPATPAAPTPQTGGTLKIILPSGSIATLGAPHEAGNPRTNIQVCEPLLWCDNNFRVYPELAEAYTVAPDGKSFTFNLRKGIKFQDGTDLNAEAVKFNFESWAAVPAGKSYLTRAVSYDVIDEYTFRLTLKAYDAQLLLQLCLGLGEMASPTAIKKQTTTENMAKDHLVGTGPFKFVSWQRNVNVKYQKFDGYWRKGKPYLDAMEIIEISDPTTALMAFKKGEGQVIFKISPRDARDLETQGYKIQLADLTAFFYLVPDAGNKDSPYADIRVREAVERAIDKDAIAKAIGQGYFKSVYQFATPTEARYVSGLAPRSFDQAKAKQLLTAAGYPNGFSTTITTTPSFDKDVLVAIQTYLKEVGINVTLDIADTSRFNNIEINGWKNGMLITSTPITADLASMNRRFAVNPTYHFSMLRPPVFMEKLSAALEQPDYDKRFAQYKELIKIIYDENMAIPLYENADISALDKKVNDLAWTQGHPFLSRPWDAWLSK